MTKAMAYVAKKEGLTPELIRERVTWRTAAISANPAHAYLKPCGVGEELTVKVNANISSSPDRYDPAEEMAKLAAVLEVGANAVMDLSTGEDLKAMSPLGAGQLPGRRGHGAHLYSRRWR